MPDKYKEENNNGVFHNGIKLVALISLIAPWFGRESIIYIVDMSSFLAAVAYFYVCYIGLKNSRGSDRIFSILGAAVSILFMGLLIIPGSPARLSTTSMILMVMWALVGFVYYKQNAKA